MVLLADITQPAVAAQIHDLQRAAYTVEAQRIGCGDFPPLRETLDVFGRCTDCFLVFITSGKMVGCLSYEQSGTVFTITRLVVSPEHFRKGIASELLRALENRVPPGSVVCAMTAALNEPAIKAYVKQGYRTEVGPTLDGIKLVRVQKKIVNAG